MMDAVEVTLESCIKYLGLVKGSYLCAGRGPLTS